MGYRIMLYKESDFEQPKRLTRVKINNFVGKKFGKLNVLSLAGVKNHFVYYKCLCDCGNITFIRSNQLQQGIAKSCGCGLIIGLANCNKKKTAEAIVGDLKNHPLHSVWTNMNRRCKSNKIDDYKKSCYKERGITICDEWDSKNKYGFLNFYNWALSNGWENKKLPNGYNYWTIDRIDNDKGYSPNNCRWATWKQQRHNQRPRKQKCKITR